MHNYKEITKKKIEHRSRVTRLFLALVLIVLRLKLGYPRLSSAVEQIPDFDRDVGSKSLAVNEEVTVIRSSPRFT